MAEITHPIAYPEVKPGAIVRLHQEISELNSKGEEKKRIQIFEGTVLQRRHGQGANAMITVRKISDGVGVEKILPLNLPSLKKIEVVKQLKVRRAKATYLRDTTQRPKEIKAKSSK